MLYVQEKGLWFFFFLLSFSLLLLWTCWGWNFESNIILTVCSLLCPFFLRVCICTHLPPLGLLKNPFTKTEQIINPHFMHGESPKQRWPASPQQQPGIFPSANAVFPDVQLQMKREWESLGLSSKVCLVWPEAPSIGQSFWWQMFFLPTWNTVRKALVGG